MLENFGLRVISERPYQLAWPEGGAAWIQDFELEHRDAPASSTSRASRRTSAKASPPPGAARSRTTASTACCSAPTSAARQIVVLRAYCRYLLQTGVPFSQAYMERTLAANAGIARSLVRLFETRFEPARRRARASAARERDADTSSRRSAPASTRSRASTTTASCAPT